MNKTEFIDYLNKNDIKEFQSKSISEHIKKELGISKSIILKLIKELKTENSIERRFYSGNCSTTCASCYEYGCDAGPRPPIGVWKIKLK